MAHRVVLLGNSWVPRLESAVRNNHVLKEHLFKPREHVLSYLHEIDGKRLYLIQNLLDNKQRIIQEVECCEELIICIGGNDVAEYPARIPEMVKELVQFAIDLHEWDIAKRVGFVECSPRLGETGFSATNVEFLPVNDEDGWEDAEDLYMEKIKVFNALLRHDVEPHPDMFVVQLTGMFNCMWDWLLPHDGKHLTPLGNDKLYTCIKRATIKASKKPCHWDFKQIYGHEQ